MSRYLKIIAVVIALPMLAGVSQCYRSAYLEGTDARICKSAIEFRVPFWSDGQVWKKYVVEAKRRGLSEAECAGLSGRFTALQIDRSEPHVVSALPVVATSHNEISKATQLALGLTTTKDAEMVNLETIPLIFRTQGIEDYRPHRALALGHPKSCGGSWHSWNRSSPRAAAESALAKCLSYREGFDAHTSKTSCGCRLVLLDNTVLGPISSLNYSRRIPVTLYSKGQNDSKPTIIKGMSSYEGLGTKKPFSLYDFNEKKMCEGRYSLTKLNAVLGNGVFTLKCFDNDYDIVGDMKVKRIPNPRGPGRLTLSIGTADLANEGKLAFIAGVPYEVLRQFPEVIENEMR